MATILQFGHSADFAVERPKLNLAGLNYRVSKIERVEKIIEEAETPKSILAQVSAKQTQKYNLRQFLVGHMASGVRGRRLTNLKPNSYIIEVRRDDGVVELRDYPVP
jgi:hypothetical protein